MITANGIEIKPTTFPDGTSQVWKLPADILEDFNNIVEVRWEFSHEAEFLHVAQLKTLLDKEGKVSSLVLTYLPYGRQDKEVANNTTFALETFAKLLNSLNFAFVEIQDAHSDKYKKIAKSIVTYPHEKLWKAYKETSSDVVCYPDKGATVKYTEVYGYYKYVTGEKVRDQTTGNIISYTFEGDVKDKNVLIVDDICDGGMTFIILAKHLKEAGANEVNLFVTHGIFSKGLHPLKEAGINRIFTAKGEAVSVAEDGYIIGYKI